MKKVRKKEEKRKKKVSHNIIIKGTSQRLRWKDDEGE